MSAHDESTVAPGFGHNGASPASVANLLRLLGAAVNQAILQRLSTGALRWNELTKGIARYAPRTIERHMPCLLQVEAVSQRRHAAAIPPAVTYELTPAGRELLQILEAKAVSSSAAPSRSGGAVQAPEILKLLGEAWESGIAAELSYQSRTHTELARQPAILSYHQLGRRLRRLEAGGMLSVHLGGGCHRAYAPTTEMRRALALTVAALGRWRARHVEVGGSGLSAAETTILLRCALPLVELPEWADRTLVISVVGDDGERIQFWATVGRGGKMRCGPGEPASACGSAAGAIQTWVALVLDGRRGRLRVGGDDAFVDACAKALERRLRGAANDLAELSRDRA